MDNKSMFSNLNGKINMLYYVVVFTMTMFFMHPLILLISFVSSFVYGIYVNGLKQIKFFFFVLIPMLLFIVILNPLINHQGENVLFYINDSMVTAESIIYGVTTGVMMINMFLYFSSFNKIMTRDKIISALDFFSKKLTLVFAMTLRFVPRYKKEFIKIKMSQSCLNEGMEDGNFFDKIRHFSNILSSFITFVLEDGIDTADTMVSRGYGIGKKSSYKKEKFTFEDKKVFMIMLVLIFIMGVGIFKGAYYISFFPKISFTGIYFESMLYYISFFVFSVIPIFIEIKEEMLWNISR